jgi:hypothetical protein
MRWVWCAALYVLLVPWQFDALGEDLKVGGQLYRSEPSLRAVLPQETHLLLTPAAIEQFLDQLDGTPPDWAKVYGQGHHDPGHDDRLFALNRERDAQREGKPVLTWLLTFVWSGALSPYDPHVGGFPVALGPKFIPTRWGLVRFKPEEPPGNLVLVVNTPQRKQIQKWIHQRRPVEIDVAMTGRLIPDESLVYDFSHEEEGRGLIMPVVRVERVDFLSVRP